MRLVAIGLAAGVFSALFGVGGGIIVVPLLVVVAGFAERTATAVSLAAIGVTALAGTVVYGVLGHLEPWYAVLVGLPAAAGAVLGTAVQQRITARALTFAFAALLAAIGAWLVVG